MKTMTMAGTPDGAPSRPARPSAFQRWQDHGAVLVLLCGSLMIGLTFTAVAPVLPSIAAHFPVFGDGALFAQMVMTVPSVGIIVGGPLVGLLIRRAGATRVLLACLAGVAICGTGGAEAENPFVLLSLRALLGLAGMGCATSAVAVIAERYDADRRARLIGLQIAITAGGASLSLLAAGALADRFGWRAPFLLYLFALLLLALGISSLHHKTQNTAAAADDVMKADGVWSVWPLYLATAVLAIPLNMPAVQVGFQLSNDGMHSAFLIACIVACFSVSLMIGAAGFARAREILGVSWVIAIGLACLGGGFVGISLSYLVWPTGAFCIVGGLGAGLLNPVLSVILLDRIDPTARGPALGILNSSFFVGELVNPFVLIPLRRALGVHGMFSLIGALLLATGFGIAARRLANRQRRPRSPSL